LMSLITGTIVVAQATGHTDIASRNKAVARSLLNRLVCNPSTDAVVYGDWVAGKTALRNNVICFHLHPHTFQ
jgi:hypothetical protein